MPTTIPDGIVTPDAGWTGGFIQAMITMANTIQAIFSRKAANSYLWATETLRQAQLGMTQGDTGRQSDIDVVFRYDGTRWNPDGLSVSDTAAARDLRIPLGQRRQGMQVLARDTMLVHEYFELYNISTNPGGQAVAGWYLVGGPVPKARVGRTAATSTSGTPNTFAAVPFDTETYDVGGMHDNATNNTRLTAPQTGYYRISFNGRITLTAAGTIDVQLRVNGTALNDSISGTSSTGATGSAYFGTAAYIYMTAGDYVEVFVRASIASQAFATTGQIAFEAFFSGI